MGRREDNKARTRQRIIDVALELFRERGFEGTRVQDIVERVGISPATFFNYFPNKLAVVEALNQGSADLYVGFLRYVVDLTDVPVLVRLEQLMRTMGMYLMADPEITKLMVVHGRLFGSETSPHDDEARAGFDLLVALFAQGQDRGELDATHDPALLAGLYTAAYVAVATGWVMQWPLPTDEPVTERLVAALHILLWGAARSRTDTANS
jgi:AcrR family transcriptional regulator